MGVVHPCIRSRNHPVYQPVKTHLSHYSAPTRQACNTGTIIRPNYFTKPDCVHCLKLWNTFEYRTMRSARELDPEVFLMAAERIDEGMACFCCNALANATLEKRLPPRRSTERDFFERILKPEESYGAWYGIVCKENVQPRVLGLLLCMEVCGEGF